MFGDSDGGQIRWDGDGTRTGERSGGPDRSDGIGTDTGGGADGPDKDGVADKPSGSAGSGRTGESDEATMHRVRTLLIVAAVAVLVVPQLVGFWRVARVTSSMSSSSSSSSWSTTPAPEDPEVTIKEGSGPLTGGDTDNTAILTVDKAVSGGADHIDGRPLIVVYYTLENTSDHAIQLNLISDPHASQHGLEIPRSSVQDVYENGEHHTPLEGYDADSRQQTVMPKEKASIQSTYRIMDVSAPVTFTAVGFHETAAVSAAFAVAAGKPMGAEFERITLSAVPKATAPDESDLKSYIPLRDWRGTTVLGYVKPLKAERGPDTSKGEHTIVVTYSWVNKRNAPKGLTDMAGLEVRKDGSKLDMTYLPEHDGDDYTANEQLMRLDPDASARIKVAYLADGPGTIEVRVRSSAQASDKKPATRTFTVS